MRVEGAPVARWFSLFDHVFPIRGKHDLGQGATNNFGGGRGHQGQDLFAGCGTPVVAARGGTVREAGYNGAAGNYAVISSSSSGFDYVYMHLRDASRVRTGETVATRGRIGLVGASGNASGCHLHFELWSAPGWYAGGKALDPLEHLRRWDRWP
jgi:murein DD-endopeptidase MepM/ murein hydrolase activator NlpD